MSKQKVVVVSNKGARIYTNPQNIEELKTQGVVLINPDIEKVKNISPSFWKLSMNGNLIPMKNIEQDKILELHDQKKEKSPVKVVRRYKITKAIKVLITHSAMLLLGIGLGMYII